MLAALRLFLLRTHGGELRPHLFLGEQFIDQHIGSGSRSSRSWLQFQSAPEVTCSHTRTTGTACADRDFFRSLADRPTSSSDARFTSKANIEATQTDVRFGSKADILTPKSGHVRCNLGCPLCANSKLLHRSKQHLYSITSVARTTIESGSVNPIAFAVFRLRTRSNFVACSTGRSAGFAPLKILSTKYAARRYIEGRFSP